MSEGQLNNANYAGRPTVCRNCGALVGPDEASCSMCGAPKVLSAVAPLEEPAPYPPPVHDRETIRFARAVLSRPYIFTIVIIVTNVFIFLLMWSSSGLNSVTMWQPPFHVLYAYGAKLNFSIDAGQWWRFVTPVFIHIGLAHLLVNMYGLWMIGPYVERLYGSAKFVALWVGTGVAGVVASYLSVRPAMAVGSVGRFFFSAGDGPSAGASGALFGLIGVLFVFGIKFRRELPDGFKRAFGTGLLPVIVLNLFIGYLGRGFIDNAAHIGGLLAGALFGLVIGYKRPGERAGVAVFWHILQIAALVLVAVSFLMVWKHFHDTIPAPVSEAAFSLPAERRELVAYLNALKAGEVAFVKAYNDGDTSGIDGAVEMLDRAPKITDEAGALRDELKSLLARVKGAAAPVKQQTRQQAQARSKEREKLRSDFEAWQQKQLKLSESLIPNPAQPGPSK